MLKKVSLARSCHLTMAASARRCCAYTATIPAYGQSTKRSQARFIMRPEEDRHVRPSGRDAGR